MLQKTMGSMLEIARIQSEINRLFENLLELKQPGDAAEQSWMPTVDILDGPETLTVLVELPGVGIEDLELLADGGNIVIRGEKKPFARPGEPMQFHCMERAHGRFQRIVNLNYPVNTHRASAELKNGLLRIVFPKVPNRRGGAVAIPVTES
jgi:HSP20 family protein